MSKKGEFYGIPFVVQKRKVKYSRIEFKKQGLQVIVPFGINPIRMLEDNKKSILKKFIKLKLLAEASDNIELITRDGDGFSAIITEIINHYREKLKIDINITIKLRKMKRRWGSCRSDGVITLNKLMIFIPKKLIEYVIYHELIHLLERYHNNRFKSMIADEYPDWKDLDRMLSTYGLKLLGKI